MNLAIIRVIAIVLFLYLTWRNLKGDYEEEKLVSFGWISMLFFLFFGRLAFGLLNWGVWESWQDWLMVWSKPGLDYLFGTLGFILSVFIFGRANGWKFFTFIEDNLRNFLFFLFLMLSDELFRSRFDFKVIVFLLIIIVAYLLVLWLSKKYRSFVWYKSGKKGFVFLFTTFFVNLGIFLTLLLFKELTFLLPLSLVISLTSLVGLFILGEVFGSINNSKKD